MTVKELAQELRIKPATLYAWASQDKIPSLKIHGVVRFERGKIVEWLRGFGLVRPSERVLIDKRKPEESVETLIARAKRSVYSSRRGNQTNSEPM